jgi:hypothetical protein
MGDQLLPKLFPIDCAIVPSSLNRGRTNNDNNNEVIDVNGDGDGDVYVFNNDRRRRRRNLVGGRVHTDATTEEEEEEEEEERRQRQLQLQQIGQTSTLVGLSIKPRDLVDEGGKYIANKYYKYCLYYTILYYAVYTELYCLYPEHMFGCCRHRCYSVSSDVVYGISPILFPFFLSLSLSFSSSLIFNF